MRGLPPGDYLLAAVEFVEQGEWHGPRFLTGVRDSAVRLTLDEGEVRSLNLTLDP